MPLPIMECCSSLEPLLWLWPRWGTHELHFGIWEYFGKVLQEKLRQPEGEAGDYSLFGHMVEAQKGVMGQFATWRTSPDWYWKTMYQHDWKLWFEESQAYNNPWWDLLYHREGEHYFLSAWINWIKPPISFVPVSQRQNVRWGCTMGLEKEALDRGDKIFFANVCDCHGFKLGFAILLQILLNFSSQIFSPATANLLCAEMQYRKYLECKNKALFPTF